MKVKLGGAEIRLQKIREIGFDFNQVREILEAKEYNHKEFTYGLKQKDGTFLLFRPAPGG